MLVSLRSWSLIWVWLSGWLCLCGCEKNTQPPALQGPLGRIVSAQQASSDVALSTPMPRARHMLKRPMVRHAWLQTYTAAKPPVGSYGYARFIKSVPFRRSQLTATAQSPLWRRRMERVGIRLQQSGVRAIVAVHGTFVGKDPLGWIHWLKAIYPQLPLWIEFQLKKWVDKVQDIVFRDLGDFPAEYATLLQQGLGGKIPCQRFLWSSRNHHYARAKATIRLVHFLTGLVPKQPSQRPTRILLLGHSHAGQLFALLTHLLASSKEVPYLLQYTLLNPQQHTKLALALRTLRRVKLEIVTLGTPPRYTWAMPGNVRLLHLINHRGSTPQGGTMSGLLLTRDGDYIQQWGIAGSDLLATTSDERKRNRHLARLLGPGLSPKAWNRARRYRMRVHSKGFNLLLDYQDQARLLQPHRWFTLMGHGVYTRYEKMLFHMELIQKRWFPAKE